jgi:hypothetical protein
MCDVDEKKGGLGGRGEQEGRRYVGGTEEGWRRGRREE